MKPGALPLVIFWGLVLSSHAARAATTISDPSLLADQTWTAAGSPYLLQGDFTVPSGMTLTLEPGTEIQFASGDSQAAGEDKDRSEFIIDGDLQAPGTAAGPILFHAQNSAGPLAWAGIVINATGTATLTHVDIQDANNAVTANGRLLNVAYSSFTHNVAGIAQGAGNAVLDAVELSNNSGYGLFVLGNANEASFSLTNAVLRLNGSYGVYASSALGQRVTGSIVNCTVHGNISSGIEGQAAGAGSLLTLVIENTIVSNNGISGIYADSTGDGTVSVSTSYSDVWSNGANFDGAEAGPHCLTDDPEYTHAPDDLTLPSTSVCNDAGTPTGMPAHDFSGSPRLASQVDLGAYAQPVMTVDVKDPALGGCQIGRNGGANWGWLSLCALALVSGRRFTRKP